MEFISLRFVLAAAIITVLTLGMTPIAAGTALYRKTDHKKAGIALRIIGYIILIPSVVSSILMIVFLF